LSNTAPQLLDVSDNTGSGAGWNVTLTTTTFLNGAVSSLANTALSVTGSTPACDASSTCTVGVSSVVLPLAIPAAAVAPTAVEIVNAAVGSGIGPQTSTNTMALFLPTATHAGTYTSTWTFSLTSAP
jgi:hypothetical protein